MDGKGTHPVVGTIQQRLAAAGCDYTLFEHEPVITSEEAAALRPDFSLSQGTKAIIVRLRHKGGRAFAMLVVPGDRQCDIKKARARTGARDIRLATAEEVAEITEGVKIGGIPPWGALFGIEMYADPSVLDHERIIFNAGDRRVSIAMRAQDWRRLAVPHIAEIARDQ